MKTSDIRIARLLQAAATLTTSGHCREDAVRTAFDLERQITEQVTKNEVAEDPRLHRGYDGPR